MGMTTLCQQRFEARKRPKIVLVLVLVVVVVLEKLRSFLAVLS
jgi:hypothetical protein